MGGHDPVDAISRNNSEVNGRAVSARSSRARALAFALEAIAVALTVGVVATGAAIPPVAPLLALLGVAVVCANRDALFSSELAATAESSVVLCAVVVFHADAPLLGPLL